MNAVEILGVKTQGTEGSHTITNGKKDLKHYLHVNKHKNNILFCFCDARILREIRFQYAVYKRHQLNAPFLTENV